MRKYFQSQIILAITLLIGLFYARDAEASKGPIAPPKIQDGQFVYQIGDCTPPGFANTQKADLNARLKNLHNPFYVVILCELPNLNDDQKAYARSNGFRGDSTTNRVEVANALLMEDWAAQEPVAYDPENSALFVIAFSPRKFAWHPALKAKNEHGLVHRNQDRYTKLFVRSAKQSPPSYVSGIGNLAAQYDEWFFDRTDPQRIAQRAEAERIRIEKLRLKNAQGALDAEISHLSSLFREKDYLPADTSSYSDSLKKAKSIRKENDPSKMMEEADQLKGTVVVLQNYVDERRAEHRNAMFLLAFQTLSALFALFFVAFMYKRRRDEQNTLIDQWSALIDEWDKKVRNANARWSEHYIEREDILGLEDIEGDTLKLWEDTTWKVDNILIRIRAMQEHKANCEKIFNKGWMFNLDPYREAIAAFKNSFDFDSGKLNKDDLFGEETVVHRFAIEYFVEQTEEMFKTSIVGWEKLKEAATARYEDARSKFPHDNMDKLFELCSEHKVPERWIDSHPLYGDEESDESFYKTLDELRMADPIAYIQKIKELRKQESKLLYLLRDIGEFRNEISRVHIGSVPDHGTQVKPEDDPELTLAEAREAEHKFEGLLASAGEDEVAEQGDIILGLYRKAAQQSAQIQAAIDGLDDAIARADEHRGRANRAFANAETALRKASRTHSQIGEAQDSIDVAKQYITQGTLLTDEEAQSKIRSSNILDARRTIDRGIAAYNRGEDSAKKAIAFCQRLDAEKADFENKLAEIERIRKRMKRKLRDYGSGLKISEFENPRIAGAANYALLLARLNSQISRWKGTVRTAQNRYDEEQRRLRQARERREREERQRRAREAARRSSYSSYSSSSSSSSSFGGFGGGGFGGSSGGFGGGGFGGSSGDF